MRPQRCRRTWPGPPRCASPGGSGPPRRRGRPPRRGRARSCRPPPRALQLGGELDAAAGDRREQLLGRWVAELVDLRGADVLAVDERLVVLRADGRHRGVLPCGLVRWTLGGG